MIPHILIVDDDPFILEVLADDISAMGYTYNRAAGGVEALQKLAEERFHIVLTDLEMPEMSGVELIDRATRSYPELIFIVVSGHHDAESIISSLHEFRSFDYLFKPIGAGALKHAIDRAFETYALRKRAETLEQTEHEFYENFLNNFNWKNELRWKEVESLTHNLVRQMNIGFFHGGGIGSLLSTVSMLLDKAIRNPQNRTFEVPEKLFGLIRENYEISIDLARCLSDAQKIMEDNRVYDHTIMLTDFPVILENYRSDLKDMLAIKRQRLLMSTLGSIPTDANITFDLEHMKIVFSELIINAMKYSQNEDEIYIMPFIKENYLEVKIMNPAYPNLDGSIGIRGRNEAMVFEPFYRLSPVVDDRYSKETVGYGLGLMVARKIVDRHNANIFIFTTKNYLDPKHDQDICVTVRFPLHCSRSPVSDLAGSHSGQAP